MAKKSKRPASPAPKLAAPKPAVVTSRPVAEPVRRPAATEPTAPVRESLRSAQPVEPASPLIRFDKRLNWFLGVCTGLFLLLTLANWNYSSVGMWNQIIPDGSAPQRGIVSGQPRSIRMDDYAVGIPWIMSEANRGYPLENISVGGEKSPVLTTPTRHFTVLFKPTNWGYFLFSVDRGYAWGVNLTIFFALVSLTLMLLLLTNNNFWLSIFGSVWILLSSGTQSWFYNAVHAVPGACLLFVSAAYLLYGTTRRQILLASLAAGWTFTNFALMLYPPYQVPLAYGIGLLFIGYVLNNPDWARIRTLWPLKLAGGVLALVIVGGVFWAFLRDLKPTFDAVTGTVYPGKRSEMGGTGFIANWFSEYFSWQTDDANFPKSWLNHCELSHYITFAPLILPFMAVSFGLNRRVDWALLLLGLYIVLLYVWIEIGFSEPLAKLTLLNMSPTRRTQIPFGICNVLLTVLYLSYLSRQPVRTRPTALTIAGAVAVLAFMLYAANVNVNDSDGFFRWSQLVGPVLFFTAMGALLIPTWQPTYRTALFSVPMLLFLLPNLKINPISKGLSPISENALYRTVQDIHRQEPQARWVVFGSQYISYLLTATGVELLSGVKYIPPRTIYKVLDPQMRRDSAYNRYAHTTYVPFVTGTDSVFMQNNFEDGCLIAMDPCSPRFKALGVRYVVFDKQPQPVENRCMKPVTTLGSIQIYHIND